MTPEEELRHTRRLLAWVADMLAEAIRYDKGDGDGADIDLVYDAKRRIDAYLLSVEPEQAAEP